MSAFLPLGFASPAILAGLALLPVIWWLLRVTPPRPREVAFPPLRLLLDVFRPEKMPARTPWWLTALRLLLAALVILALAGPVWRPDIGTAARSGPLMLVIDNGWSAAPAWARVQEAARRLIDRAERDGRAVAVLATAEGPGQLAGPFAAGEAKARVGAIQPRPWAPERADALDALRSAAAASPPAEIVWMGEPLDHGSGDAFAAALAETAGQADIVFFRHDGPTPLGLVGVENGIEALAARLARAGAADRATGLIRAYDAKGRLVAEQSFAFEGDGFSAETAFRLPIEIRNDLARLEISGEGTAGAVRLLDERWRRRSVGLVSGASADLAQPLLSPLHYIARAIAPFADLREPRTADLMVAVPRLVADKVSVIVVADVGTLAGDAAKALAQWVADGGVLIRFAGPRMAAGRGDALTPVTLRQGGRTLGGALSWAEPQHLGAFSGPFSGLAVPRDVTVSRQVLAEPDATLAGKTWATLADGTPLVTADKLGEGWIVLFHVSADTTWSNLPLSGAFVEMLRRIVALSASTGAAGPAGAQSVVLPPLRLLDASGRLVAPSVDAKPLPRQNAPSRGTREHPPGLYGGEDAFVALNLLEANDKLVALSPRSLGPRARVESYRAEGPVELAPHALALAALLLLLDGVAVLALAGILRLRRPALGAVLLALLAATLVAPHAALAQAPARKQPDLKAMEAALTTRLAYVVTGNREIDEVSRRGLEGLTRVLADRTALEPALPAPVDPSRDELAVYPILYWPIDPAAPTPDAAAMARVDAFMKNGGTVLFDTRDALTSLPLRGGGRGSPATEKLREILSTLDVPPLEPVPADHVLTKAFYLLQQFPGRYDGGELWVEALPDDRGPAGRPVRPGDGVSPILIVGNDLAGAWATTDSGEPLLPTVPPDPRQRELAYRVGVNILMYVLTGNYKADQVHVPAILERLGQ